MKHTVQALGLLEPAQAALERRGLRPGRAFWQHYVKLINAALFLDLEDIHREINAARLPVEDDHPGPTANDLAQG